MLATARTSPNINDFALVAMLGLLGLRIFEACGADIEDLGEEHGQRVLKVRGKGGKVVLTPLPPAVSRAIERAVADRECGPILRTRNGTGGPALRTARPHRTPPGCTRTCCATPSSPPCSTPASTCATCRCRQGRRPSHEPA